jgi:hypothetical protein
MLSQGINYDKTFGQHRPATIENVIRLVHILISKLIV